MMDWTLAAVQMDCRLMETEKNLAAVVDRLRIAASRGADFVAFPECILTGYCLPDRETAMRVAQSVPGPATDVLAAECRTLKIFAGVGHLERDGDRVFNVYTLFGPQGLVANYRKIHLPHVGVDCFIDRGDKPFEVHDCGGVKIGVGICFDNSFPESVRIMALMGADVVLQPTNWATQAMKNATLVAPVRAFENHIFYAAIDRIGDEGGHHFIGRSSIINCVGDFLAFADHDREEIITSTFDPTVARQKRTVNIPGVYEIDRINWRRPEMYGRLTT